MKIIAMSAKLGCGKSTLCEYIISQTINSQPNIRRMSFAGVLKEEVARIFDVDIDTFYTGKQDILTLSPMIEVDGEMLDLPNSGIMTARKLLQWWGTDVRRKNDPEYWTNEARTILKGVIGTTVSVVLIDDMRFNNELDLVKELGGTTIRLNRYEGYLIDKEADKHPSETALDHAEFDLTYAPDFGKLQETAKEIVNTLGL